MARERRRRWGCGNRARNDQRRDDEAIVMPAYQSPHDMRPHDIGKPGFDADGAPVCLNATAINADNTLDFGIGLRLVS